MVRSNRLKSILESGETALGAGSLLVSPNIIELYGELGLDYVFLDFEHIGPDVWNSFTFENLSRAADLTDIELLVRLPSGAPSTHPPRIRKVLDTGVRNVIIPRIETADEVRHAVEATRFTYQGNPGGRGVGATRSNLWSYGNSESWPEQQDDTVLCGVMIENETAVANLDDILEVAGLDFVGIGHNDLAVSMGRPLEPDHPNVRETVREIERHCGEKGVPFCHWGTLKSQVDQDAQLINLTSDLVAIQQVVEERLSEYREHQHADED